MDCFDYDKSFQKTDYFASSLASTSLDCQSTCLFQPDCDFFEFDEISTTCFFKSFGQVASKIPSTNLLAGKPTCLMNQGKYKQLFHKSFAKVEIRSS